MNRKINKLLTSIAAISMALILANGCNKNAQTNDKVSELMQIKGKINADSKVANEAFQNDDKISLFAVKYTGDTPNTLGNNVQTYINNQMCLYVGDYFVPYNDGQPVDIYYPSDGSMADIYALWPYQSTVSDHTAIPVSVPTSQSESNWYSYDYMMAKLNEVEQSPIPNVLVFNHLLAKMTVNVVLTGFEPSVKVDNVKILDMYLDATLDITSFDGSSISSKLGTSKGSITPKSLATPTTGYDHTVELLIPSQPVYNTSKLVTFELNNGNNYHLEVSEYFMLEAGKNNVLNVTLSFGSYNEVTAGATVTAWNENSYALPEVDPVSEFIFTGILIGAESLGLNATLGMQARLNDMMTVGLNAVEYVAESGIAGAYYSNPAIKFEFGTTPADLGWKISELRFFKNGSSYTNANLLATAVSSTDQVIVTTESSTPRVIYINLADGELNIHNTASSINN